MSPTIAMAAEIAMAGDQERATRVLIAGRVRVRTAQRADGALARAAGAAWDDCDHRGYARVQRARAALEPVIAGRWGYP